VTSSEDQHAAPTGEVTPAGEHGTVEVPEHRHERPEDWGWHAETGKVSRGGAVVIAAILLVMLIGNDIGNIAKIYLVGLALGLLVILAWDRHRRKTAWRNK
jgi:hypothetical protein